MAGVAAAAGALPLSTALTQSRGEKREKTVLPFDLGIASYTFRMFTLDQAIAMTKRVGIGKLALKDVHLPLTSSRRKLLRSWRR